MARSGDGEKGEASRKRLGLPESGAKYERAKKKARPTENVSKVSRKRAWDEVIERESLNDDDQPTSHRPSRKVLKKNGGEGDTQESVSTLWDKSDVQGPDLSQRKWKRTPKTANSIRNSGPSGSCLREAPGGSEENPGTRSAKERKQKQSRENEVVRKVLQTVHLEESRIDEHEESNIGLENVSAGIVSSLEQTVLNGRDRKRREPNKGEGSPPRQPKKKLRIDDAGAEASHRSEEQGTRVNTNTWKRLKRDQTGNSAAAASEDMGVSISEAWKRLRDEKDTETSGSSVNGRSDSDLSMHSVPEWIEERSKKARYENLPVGRKWKRQNREKKQSSSSKRPRDGNGCESTSGSSGSDMAQSSYLHNRKWKRPRYENLMMSVQGRSLRRQQPRDGEERYRKRVKGDAASEGQS